MLRRSRWIFPIPARRGQRPGHAKICTTTHLRGSSLKPLAMSERFTIWSVQRPSGTRASQNFGPAWLPSASMWRLRPLMRLSFGAVLGPVAHPPLTIIGKRRFFRWFSTPAVDHAGGRLDLARLVPTEPPSSSTCLEADAERGSHGSGNLSAIGPLKRSRMAMPLTSRVCIEHCAGPLSAPGTPTSLQTACKAIGSIGVA